MGTIGYLEMSANTKPRCVTTKKSEHDVYTAAEASNHSIAGLISYFTSAEIRDHFRTKCKYKSDSLAT